MRFLVVEDDATSRRLLQLILAPYGSVDEAENGVAAVDCFESSLRGGHPYHLVCMDIMMPEMDGQEALRRIRALEAESGVPVSESSKVVMTTALDDPANVAEAYFRGRADSYVPKPIDRGILLNVLRRMGVIH